MKFFSKEKEEKKPINKEEPQEEKFDLKKEIIDFVKDLVIVLVFVLIIRTYLISPFQISWQSMYDSFYNKEFIIVDRFSYLDIPFIWKIWRPNRGDVVVFKPHVNKNKAYYIKRIIWIPGDTVQIKSWKVYLKKSQGEDFILLGEPYLSENNVSMTYVSKTTTDDNLEQIYEVPEDSYFLLWDNRVLSTDSRHCFYSCIFSDRTHFIWKKDIIWKVFLDLWYFDIKALSFTHPDLWFPTKPRFLNTMREHQY